jgi:hypothetical protein
MITGVGRTEPCHAFQEFEFRIPCMNADVILLWMDKESRNFKRIEYRGFGGDTWLLRNAVRLTACLVDCYGTATPAPWGRSSIGLPPCASSTRSLGPIRPTTLWYSIVGALFIPFTPRTVVALRLGTVTTDLAPTASES